MKLDRPDINMRGQVVLILLLVMTLGLSVALSIIGRSLSDISTSTKIEQSSRAYSAAEAGIENALKGDTSNVTFTDNQSSAAVIDSGTLPAPNQPLAYPPISKEEIAQFWLEDPSTPGVITPYYSQSTINVYWGTPPNQLTSSSDQAAIEINVFYQDTSNNIQVKKFLVDPNSSRRSNNNFLAPTNDPCPNTGISLSVSGQAKNFYCYKTLDLSASSLPNLSILLLIRLRLLYTNVPQAVAVAPVGNCGFACSLPPQAHIYTSTGSSGNTQRTVQLFKEDKVIPFYFDYAIFSQSDIQK